MAWHHYVLVECAEATFKIELLREGVRVQAILAPDEVDGNIWSDGANFVYRRQRLTHTMPGTRHKEAGQAVRHVDLNRRATVDPLIAWVVAHANTEYNLVDWNCQHFVSGLMGVCEHAAFS